MTGSEIERRRAADDFEFFVMLFGATQSQLSLARQIVETILKERLVIEKMTSDVKEFHEEVVGLETPTFPRPLSPDRREFRIKFLKEELDEFIDSMTMVDDVDALIDLIYVALGALLEMGVPPMDAWNPVQLANMAKVRGMTKRGHGFDAVKPEGWLPPDHEAVLARLALQASVSPAFLEATRIREERGVKYNQGSVTRKDHFPFGHVGFAQMLWIKMIRLRSEIEGYMANPPQTPEETETFNARVAEHLRDNMNYEAFYWEWINGGVL